MGNGLVHAIIDGFILLCIQMNPRIIQLLCSPLQAAILTSAVLYNHFIIREILHQYALKCFL